MAEVPESGGPVAEGRPALDVTGLAERWTPQIAATRQRAGRALIVAIACVPIVFVVAPMSEANNSWPGAVVALATTALGVGLVTYSLVLQQRTRRAVSDLYAIARDERPPLEPLRVRTVPQFDAWLNLHDRVPADRERGRLQR